MPRDDWVGGKMKSPEEHPDVDPMHVKILSYQPEIYTLMQEYDKMIYVSNQKKRNLADHYF